MSCHMPSSTCLPSKSTSRVSDGQGGVGANDVEEAGFAAAGFTSGENVVVDQADVDRGAELVDAEEQRVIHREHGTDRNGRYRLFDGDSTGEWPDDGGSHGEPFRRRRVSVGGRKWARGISRDAPRPIADRSIDQMALVDEVADVIAARTGHQGRAIQRGGFGRGAFLSLVTRRG